MCKYYYFSQLNHVVVNLVNRLNSRFFADGKYSIVRDSVPHKGK